MSTIHETYRAAARPLGELLRTVPAERWSAPSPCEGWSAADVVHHVIETQSSLLEGAGVTPPDRPGTGADPADAWAAHEKGVLDLLADPDVTGRVYEGVFGPTTLGRTLDTYYVFDMIVHRWDVARSVGGDTGFTDQEVERLEAAVDGFGEHAYTEGVFVRGPEAAPDASRQERVLARMGRSA
ncbi:maleylpyruvate isomerase family mycothiol-dependent enzyme [Nocardiopsis ganjiahuensis]|uniref:maleylpyruvate isomerase family mycothiol-dependent enzyme n=1 Tax=Nocardiopsis ganjiahuensis TaxID=239984 RepID=UPI00037D86C8|nr:maleylpyruvate isomerase family mycothiol-dependent enzyme [Nocardiopsis ganjiahuensis]